MLFKLSKVISQIIPLECTLSMYKKGRFEEAYSILNQAINKKSQLSKNGNAYLLLAELEIVVNEDYNKALELLQKAKEFGYMDKEFYYNSHGKAMLGIENYKNAILDFEQSVIIDRNISNLTMLAQVLSQIDDKRALNIWHQVLEKDKNNCLAHAFIGLELFKSGNLGEAMLMAKRAEKLNPDAEDFYYIGYLYHGLNEFQSAINIYLEANRLGYKHKALLFASVAACYLSLGQLDQAKRYIQWALKYEPENDYAKYVWHEYEDRYNQ